MQARLEAGSLGRRATADDGVPSTSIASTEQRSLEMPRAKIHEFEGNELIVRWDQKRCIHAENCVHGSPEVFDPRRRPWIDPDRLAADQVERIVMNCPTGALHYERKDGSSTEPLPRLNTVRLRADGPMLVSGRIDLTFADGSRARESRVALCRCGASKNKPYCDNSHVGAGFSDKGALGAAMLAPAEASESEASIEISTVANGPLLVRGPIEIHSADGRESHGGAKGALCRCGASGNRPYCDGSHNSAGFEAE